MILSSVSQSPNYLLSSFWYAIFRCSLLPYGHHPTVAALCIKHKKNMVTASYVLPAMRELNDRYVLNKD